VLKEYFEDIGGRPEKKGVKRKGRASTAKSETGTPASSTKRTKAAKEEPVEKAWIPPPGSWEHDVSHIDTVEQSVDPKTGKDAKYAYIVWNNQRKTQHPLKHIYAKCPQKVRQTKDTSYMC
jgi:chromobox protein 1